MSDWGYDERAVMYADLTLHQWQDMLLGEDPDDRDIREAHGIGFLEQDRPLVSCRSCGLAWLDIISGKIRQCKS